LSVKKKRGKNESMRVIDFIVSGVRRPVQVLLPKPR